MEQALPKEGKCARSVAAFVFIGICIAVIIYQENIPKILAPGFKLEIKGVNWSSRTRNIVLIMSVGCRHCEENLDLFRTIARNAKEHRSSKVIAVFPQPVRAARDYLSKAGLKVDEVYSIPLSAIGAFVTPTIAIVDNTGTAVYVCMGMLTKAKRYEILEEIW